MCSPFERTISIFHWQLTYIRFYLQNIAQVLFCQFRYPFWYQSFKIFIGTLDNNKNILFRAWDIFKGWYTYMLISNTITKLLLKKNQSKQLLFKCKYLCNIVWNCKNRKKKVTPACVLAPPANYHLLSSTIFLFPSSTLVKLLLMFLVCK